MLEDLTGLPARPLLLPWTATAGELPRAEEGVRRAVEAGDEVVGGTPLVGCGSGDALDNGGGTVLEFEEDGRGGAGPGLGFPKKPMSVACRGLQ